MLQNLREHAQGWIAAVIATILCLAFALWGIEYYLTGSSVSQVVATVGGEEITQQDWDYAYQRLQRQKKLSSPSSDLNPTTQDPLKQTALKNLIDQAVLAKAAENSGFEVSNNQIGQLIAYLPIFQVNGQFSLPAYQQVTSNAFPSEQAFLLDLKKIGLIAQPKVGIMVSAFALPNEIDQAIVLTEQKRDLSYAIIPATRFLKTVDVSPAEVQAYYKMHQNEFMTPEQVSLEYLELSSEETKLLGDRSDQLANLTYTNPDTLKVAADQLGLPIKTTELFGRAGGKSALTANPKIVAVAFSDNVLQQHNNSDVISLNGQSLLVLRVAHYQAAKVRPFAEIQPIIQQKLQAQAAQKAAKLLGEVILAELKTGVTLEKIAVQHQVWWKQKVKVGRQTSDIPAGLVRLAFNLPPPGSATKPSWGGIGLPEGDYAIVGVTQLESGVVASFNKEQRKSVFDYLAEMFGSVDYQLYVKQATQEIAVKSP